MGRLMLYTCSHNDPAVGEVTIGWSNVAFNREFREFIEARMVLGVQYALLADQAVDVIYNDALKIDHATPPPHIAAVRRWMPQFLAGGHVSIVRLSGPRRTIGMATAATCVLAHHTLEMA